MKPFTKKQIKRYFNNPNECPVCEEETIKIEEDFLEETKSREIHCENCGCEFHEIYELITIEKK